MEMNFCCLKSPSCCLGEAGTKIDFGLDKLNGKTFHPEQRPRMENTSSLPVQHKESSHSGVSKCCREVLHEQKLIKCII